MIIKNEFTSLGKVTDIKNIDQGYISEVINTVRSFLVKSDYNEVTLFNTTKYRVENTEHIITQTGEFLRSTTEPDIWTLGMDYPKFYCITSLFRNEDMYSYLHKNEFKILDFYVKNVDVDFMINQLFKIFNFLEKKLSLPSISKLKLSSVDYEEFKTINSLKFGKGIIKVENYPIEESFYDSIDEKTHKSKKGELFFMGMNHPIEFSVFGKVDDNKNQTNRINSFEIDNIDFKTLDLYGMCLGIERIILCYHSLKSLT